MVGPKRLCTTRDVWRTTGHRTTIAIDLPTLFSGLLPPFSDFFNVVLSHYHIHALSLGPKQILLLSSFSFLCEAFLGIAPSVVLLRHFFYLFLTAANQCSGCVYLRVVGAGRTSPLNQKGARGPIDAHPSTLKAMMLEVANMPGTTMASGDMGDAVGAGDAAVVSPVAEAGKKGAGGEQHRRLGELGPGAVGERDTQAPHIRHINGRAQNSSAQSELSRDPPAAPVTRAAAGHAPRLEQDRVLSGATDV
ncbi:hypothetical protein D1007_37662 [Hordeum vulgare]|nr:hypothetical protein D1007_37662 [Hordeum vulgare]